MKVIGPLRIDFVSPLLPVRDDPRIIQIALRDQMDRPPEPLRQLCHARLQLRQEWKRAEIENPMYCIQPKRIKVILLKPVKRVFAEESPHLIAAPPVVVDGLSPRRAIAIGEVGTISAEVVSFRAEMVVYDVQSHCQSVGMSRSHQPLQSFWTTIRVLWGERKHSVVAPISCPGKLRYWHYFDGSHTE